MTPTVSVIVPVYNAARAVRRLYDSLRAQDYPPDRVEIIMVDNGSDDGSAGVIGSLPGVTALSETRRAGPAAARNAGIEQARGDILAFIDADCWAHPRWLSAGVARMTEGGFDRVAGRVDFVLSAYPNIYEIYDSAVNFRQGDFMAAGWSGTGNLFVRREVFDEVGPFDPALLSHEDGEWGLRATRANKSLGYAPDAVACHRARRSFASLVKKWTRTEYGAAQAWRRHGLFDLHLWNRKANWRPLWHTWRSMPEPVRRNPHLRFSFDLLANALRLAGNVGSLAGYLRLPPPTRK